MITSETSFLSIQERNRYIALLFWGNSSPGVKPPVSSAHACDVLATLAFGSQRILCYVLIRYTFSTKSQNSENVRQSRGRIWGGLSQLAHDAPFAQTMDTWVVWLSRSCDAHHEASTCRARHVAQPEAKRQLGAPMRPQPHTALAPTPEQPCPVHAGPAEETRSHTQQTPEQARALGGKPHAPWQVLSVHPESTSQSARGTSQPFIAIKEMQTESNSIAFSPAKLAKVAPEDNGCRCHACWLAQGTRAPRPS